MGTINDALRARSWRRKLLIGSAGLVIAGTTSVAAVVHAAPAPRPAATLAVAASNVPAASCTAATCKSSLAVNPGLTAGHPFACPAIANAKATIAVTNRFKKGTLNDTMTLTASGLPPNTGFDLFTVEHSPFDTGFTAFGFGWYQSDVESDSTGHATVKVVGIFDRETFIENPSAPTTPVHTFNVGFWFDSPTTEAAKCGGAVPAATPFNGEQDAGLLAMITSGAPLGNIG
jgi:hypothetical protein